MKKITFLFCFLSLSLVQAEETETAQVASATIGFKLKGDADFFFELAHKPSSVQGQSRFDFALLQLSPDLQIRNDLALKLRLVLADERSNVQKNYYNEVQNAFVVYQDHRFQRLTHELGLIRNAWIESEKIAATMDFFGVSARSLSRRYGFLGEGDLGYQGLWKQNNRWSFAFSFANGEENKADEQGPNKMATAAAFFTGEKNRAQLLLGYGRVDRLDANVNEKQRILIRFERVWGRMTFGLEGVYAKDPSVDLESQHRLDGIMFTELSDPREINTTGGRAELSYQLSDPQLVMVRIDRLVPQWEKKRVQSFEAAWIKRESENMHWGLFYEKTDFGTEHSSQAKTREWGRIGLGLNF